MNLKYTLTASLAAFMLALSCHAANPISKFSELSKTDRFVISYKTGGYFRVFQWELIFYPQGNGYFEATEILPDETKNAVKKGKEVRGSIILEKGEKEKLDALLDFYRSPVPDDELVSTTITTVAIKQLRGNKVIAEETFTDGRFDPPSDSGILTFSEMTSALKKAQNNK